MVRLFKKSHIYSSKSWSLNDFRSDADLGEHTLAKWHSRESMSARHEIVLESIGQYCRGGVSVLVDYGCGGGAFLEGASARWPESIKIGLDVSAPLLRLARKKRIPGCHFCNRKIQKRLPGQVKRIVKSPPVGGGSSVATLIGVLQNCESHPAELLQNIIGHYEYDAIFVTTKISLDGNVRRSKLKHSVFLLSELLQVFLSLGLEVLHFSPLYSEHLVRPSVSGTFNGLFIVRASVRPPLL